MAVPLADFGRQIELAVSNMLPPAKRVEAVRRVAGQVLSEVQEANRRELGEVPDHTTFVDGEKRPGLDRLDPDRGTIAFVFEIDRLVDIVVEAHRLVVQHSPVLSGEYRDAHRILADGADVTGALPPPAERIKVREWVVLNPVPYSRKIERGLSRQAPDGVYEAVAAMLNRRHARRARIDFTFRSPLLSYVAGGGNRRERAALRDQPARRAAMDIERQTRVPAITIRAVRT